MCTCEISILHWTYDGELFVSFLNIAYMTVYDPNSWKSEPQPNFEKYHEIWRDLNNDKFVLLIDFKIRINK